MVRMAYDKYVAILTNKQTVLLSIVLSHKVILWELYTKRLSGPQGNLS